MKQLFVLCALISSLSLNAQNEFITKWVFPTATTQIRFNALTDGAVNYTWSASPSGNSGIGSFTQILYTPATLSLTIAAGDTVILSMTATNLRRFYNYYDPDYLESEYLTDVSQWGAVPWTSMESAFLGCVNLQISATDVPNLSGVTSMYQMFEDCSMLNGPSNINNWNTASVTNMRSMFQRATSFNQNIGNWNTASVTDMHSMFRQATAFNQNIGNLTLNAGVNMGNMLDNTGMDCNRYSNTLIGWQGNNSSVMNRNLGAVGLSYSSTATAARNTLTTTQGWIINDAGITTCNISIAGLDDAPQLTIYPNPTNGALYILLPEALLGQTILLINIMGQVLETSIINNTMVDYDLENLSNGIYFIQVQTQNGIISGKIIKN